MILTKVISHHQDTAVYINLDQVVSVYIHDGVDYHVEMVDGSSMHIKLDDVTISTLISDANTAYTPPT